MKVKIKTNVPSGKPGITYFGHTYKWHGKYYDMGMEYKIAAEDFNPDIMVSLEPPKAVEAPPLPEVVLPKGTAAGEEEAVPEAPVDLKEEEVQKPSSSKKSKKHSTK